MARRGKLNIRGKLGVGDHHHRIAETPVAVSMLAGIGILFVLFAIVAAIFGG